MNERFFELKKDRQDRIINGAMRIFAQNGYRHASTDEMVAAASISKGLLGSLTVE
jgi:AcrR family transcriptional regulator